MIGLLAPVDGGAPVLGEPLPVELINTEYAVGGKPHDGLTAPGELMHWLASIRDRVDVPLYDEVLATVSSSHLREFLRLRHNVRNLALAVVNGATPTVFDVAELNALCGLVSSSPVLHWSESEEPWLGTVPHGDPVLAVLAEIARDMAHLVTGEERDQIRSCQGPGCVLFFVKTHPRRAWCSAACGNRARVARHYQRTKV